MTAAPRQRSKSELLADLIEARTATDAILARVDDGAHRQQFHPDFSPVGWHQGHIALFEEFWLLQRAKGEPSRWPDLEAIFSPLQAPKDLRAALIPPRAEIETFVRDVRERSLDFLARADFDAPHEYLHNGRIVQTVISHEHQHLETMMYSLAVHGLVGEASTPPQSRLDWTPVDHGVVVVPAGSMHIGAIDDPWAYDNEHTGHMVSLDAFAIDRCATSNAQFASFVADGGYARADLWSAEAWAWRSREQLSGPRYWGRDPLSHARERLDPRAPVERISWFEAAAYARWSGGRLPAEAEWERAARFDPAREHPRTFPWGENPPDARHAVFDRQIAGTAPVDHARDGASALGCLGMAGGVWEWTADAFTPYPGFAPWPYAGYSQPYFDGRHRVLRGGSWASRRTAIRSTFRNWYTPDTSAVFAGVRVVRPLASTATLPTQPSPAIRYGGQLP